MKKNVTMRDIGAALGVSTVTISKALSGKDGVSESVRDKILETARQMGYHYGAPQPEAEGKTKIIGILIADRHFSAPSFYSSLYRELLQEIAENGMLGVLEIISDQDEQGLKPPVSMTVQKVSGIFLIGQFAEEYIAAVLDTGLPTVLLDFYSDGVDADAVISDSFGGICQLTRHLIEKGHREIGFIGTPERTTSLKHRYSGFLYTMVSSGLPVRPEWVIPDCDEEGRYTEQLELPEKLPTAFVCNNDVVACALAHQLEKRGIRVPEDISLTGFDDFVYGRYARPLTTFAVDQKRMAQEAMRRMNIRIREGMEGSVRTVVCGWFIERGSVSEIQPD